MKLLHSFVVITVLVTVAVALPSKAKEEIVAERDQLVEDLVQYQEEAPLRKRAEQCSKKLGSNAIIIANAAVQLLPAILST
uniref:U14-Hexatoxin-Hf1al_1 n=1 Tax=Hadronyche formidabilis TaxID=426499 RepID=A0A4Q8K9W2_HADFO